MHLHHVRAGDGPPLLMVHGIGMSHRAYHQVWPRLADTFACYAVDLPGFGSSPPLDGPATLHALARACAEFMAGQGHERFHIVGNSLGGGVALHLALDGTAFSACALSPIGFVEGWERAHLQLSLALARRTAPMMRRAMPVIGRPAALRRALLSQYANRGERLTPRDAADGFAELQAATGYENARRHAINWRCPTVPGPLPCPVTVAWGDKDRLLLAGPQAARARERLPRARHVPLPGLGHLPTWDDPARVAEVVRETASASTSAAAAAPA